MAASTHDAVIVGGGHNALVAATLLARSGHSVLLLERSGELGGAAVSARPFEGVDVSMSRYAYLVSLFPAELMAHLGVAVELRRRRVASCTPDGGAALLVGDSAEATKRSFELAIAQGGEYERFVAWQELIEGIAAALAPTLLAPLVPAERVEQLVGGRAFELLVGAPLGSSLRASFESDLVRGLVATDGLIGTFVHCDDASLRQNRCFLYHVIGNGHGRWDVPVGGMGAISTALAASARLAGAEMHTGAEVVSLDADGSSALLHTADDKVHRARVVLCGAAPAVLARLLGAGDPPPAPEGAQLKLNMVLRRLPRLASGVAPAEAFTGTLHVNERLSQLDGAFATAASGMLPAELPCELYCHSLTDPSIVGPGLRLEGVQTLTAFALHTPARLFGEDRAASAARAEAALLASIQSVLSEPLEECLLETPEGRPCLEMRTPLDLEDELAMPGGHIFHGDLRWPWAESDDEVGRWGVETDLANVFVCGAGARRGGGVSGIGGHNAAMAAIEHLAGRGGGRARQSKAVGRSR